MLEVTLKDYTYISTLVLVVVQSVVVRSRALHHGKHRVLLIWRLVVQLVALTNIFHVRSPSLV